MYMSTFTRLISAAVLLGVAFMTTGCQTATADKSKGYGKQKVVYHINYDNPKKQKGALRNIQNHINAVGAENLDLRVVMHGNGVSMVLEPDALPMVPKFKQANANMTQQATIANLKGQGIAFAICANTLKGRKVDADQMLYDVDKADIVPSGVAEVAHLQKHGYAYVKP
jgi:intracellular sulfur oxidation DsrE/DsrF family protein